MSKRQQPQPFADASLNCQVLTVGVLWLRRQSRRGRAPFEFWEGSCQPLVVSTDINGKPWR